MVWVYLVALNWVEVSLGSLRPTETEGSLWREKNTSRRRASRVERSQCAPLIASYAINLTCLETFRTLKCNFFLEESLHTSRACCWGKTKKGMLEWFNRVEAFTWFQFSTHTSFWRKEGIIEATSLAFVMAAAPLWFTRCSCALLQYFQANFIKFSSFP